MVKLQPGKAYSFLYPRYNYTGLPEKWEIRRVLVTHVRDTQRDRLDPGTAGINPRLIRSRWLITGRDLDKGAERSFYRDSMRQVKQFDPDEQPLRSHRFAVIDRTRVVYSSISMSESVAFMLGADRGVLCGVLGDQWTSGH
jgi:hypothetical protein